MANSGRAFAASAERWPKVAALYRAPGAWPRLLRVSVASALLWLAGLACRGIGANRTTAALTLVLGVLALSTARDRLIAVLCAISATLSLNYYFIEGPNRQRTNALSAAVTLFALLVTALTASELSIRAQRRADDAERRRREIERLQRLTQALVGARSVGEAARQSVRALGEIFSASRVVLRLAGAESVEFTGDTARDFAGISPTRLILACEVPDVSIEFFGPELSPEIRSAVASLVGLALDRARDFEEYARRDAVRRGDELRTTILNAVAHDFRTPLTSIKAAASALRASSAAVFEADRELVAIVNEEVDRLESLIRESLALARIETLDKVSAELYPVAGIVNAVTSRLAPNLNRRRVEIDVTDDLPCIAGDRFLLELMLLQVVENAWKYSAPGARIRIESHAPGDHIEIAVWNEGLRIPDYETERIFDKFYRGVGDRSRTEGSGLGLAIAKSIAEAHRGSIRLDDRADGVCFRFVFPAGQPEDDVSKPNDPSN